MFQYYEMKRLQPLVRGPHKEIDFCNKMYIQFNRVCFTFKSEFVILAETSLALNNSRQLQVIVYFKNTPTNL